MTEKNPCEGLCESRPNSEITEVGGGVSRRAALIGLAGVLGAIGLSSISTSALAAAKTYKVCKTTDIKVGSARMFSVGGRAIVITQPKSNVFRAFNGACTHQGALLANNVGPVRTVQTSMVCPQHGAAFDTNTGAATRGPASAPLAKVTVKVAAGQVSVSF